MKIAKHLLLLLTLLAIGQGIYYYPQLPDTLASRFGVGGEANSWSSKNVFFAIYFGVIFLELITFRGAPSVIRRVPVSMFNLPNKDHWLSPEHRSQTFEFIESSLIGLASFILCSPSQSFNLRFWKSAKEPSPSGYRGLDIIGSVRTLLDNLAHSVLR